MKTTKVQAFILFTLGYWFGQANEKIEDKPLKVSISKKVFIDLVMKAGFAKKQERALYKNLEILEKNKLLYYGNKELSITKKGERQFAKILKDIKPYFEVMLNLNKY